MPYKVVRQGRNLLVVKKDDEQVMGKHKTSESATAQLRALYAAKKEK